MIVCWVTLGPVFAKSHRQSGKCRADYISQITVCEVEHVGHMEYFAFGGPIVEHAVDQFGKIVGAEKACLLVLLLAERQCARFRLFK